MSAKKEKNVKEKKKISLTSMIFIALIAGAITGMVLHYLVPDSSVKNDVIVEGVLYVLGQGFIRLMKMLVVPLVFCSLVCGSIILLELNQFFHQDQMPGTADREPLRDSLHNTKNNYF